MQVNLGVKPGVYSNGEKLSDIYAYNHYGSETIPPRPVLRIAAEKIIESAECKNRIARMAKHIIDYNLHDRPQDAKDVEEKFYIWLGQQIIAEAKNIIKSGNELQPNAPKTIKKKGFDLPLFETGEIMIKNLGYEIEE